MENKRKYRDGSSLSSTQSKDAREGKGKKQRKCNGALSDAEKKPKADKKKVPEEAPAGYIHVIARRGQETDSHSLAERVRREKISERMKLLQGLVPGCDKFLSMKLASVNPMFYNFGMDLDAFMVKPERLSNLSSPLPSVQQCSPTQSTAFTIATNNYPLLDNSASLLLQQEQSLNAFSQDNGSLLWVSSLGQYGCLSVDASWYHGTSGRSESYFDSVQ